MKLQTRALLVHLLTATGAVFAMLALLAAAQGQWSIMFLWLVVAFAVDGIDGPLARKYDVKLNSPRFDGVLLDLIIDYLTYVFIPAFALFQSDLLPGWTGWVTIFVITFASALYFADSKMKTEDNSFQGFPGCWNMLVLVLFAVKPAVPADPRPRRADRDRDVPADQVHPPGAHGALAVPVLADRLCLDVLRGLGGMGGFPPRKLGDVGSRRDVGLPARGGRRAADRSRPRRGQGRTGGVTQKLSTQGRRVSSWLHAERCCTMRLA